MAVTVNPTPRWKTMSGSRSRIAWAVVRVTVIRSSIGKRMISSKQLSTSGSCGSPWQTPITSNFSRSERTAREWVRKMA